jgi:hypothetical protein
VQCTLQGLLLVALSACSLITPWATLYSGDGAYLKRPGMYQLRLSEVSLDRPNSKCASFSNLGPDWEWNVGIRLEQADGNSADMFVGDTSQLKPELIPRARLALRLSDDSNREVFAVSGPLNDWKWNWNRGYLEGRGEEYRSAPGTYRFRRFDVGPDQSWGSNFTPRFSAKYTLCYTVTQAAPVIPRAVAVLTVETYLGSL